MGSSMPPQRSIGQDLPRSIGFWGGTAIMAGLIIGTGIFRTPTSIAAELTSPAWILLLWLAGGLLSLFGAIAFAELGTTFPQSGGIYVYLHRGFGPQVAFAFGWAYLLIAKPLAIAGLAFVFAEHLLWLLGVEWSVPLVTSVAILVLAGVNTVGTRVGAGLAVLLTALKVAALVGIAILGSVLLEGSAMNFTAAPSSGSLAGRLVAALAMVLWTYDGWNDITSVAGEIRRPQVALPRILVAGVALICLLYLVVNAVYIYMVSLAEMREIQWVAPLAVERMIGPLGGTVVTLIIVVSTFGATHSSILTGTRVTFAQAREGMLFRSLGFVHPVYGTPVVSIWCQCLLACVAAFYLKEFSALAGGFIFTMWIFYGLAVLGVIVLRVRRPQLERPYRCWGYPFVPIVFVASAAGMTGLSIYESALRGELWEKRLIWLIVLLAGVPMYYVWRRFAKPNASVP